jgi:hypothetical protein
MPLAFTGRATAKLWARLRQCLRRRGTRQLVKENLLWVRTFDTIEEPRAALVEFATRYNETLELLNHKFNCFGRNVEGDSNGSA